MYKIFSNLWLWKVAQHFYKCALLEFGKLCISKICLSMFFILFSLLLKPLKSSPVLNISSENDSPVKDADSPFALFKVKKRCTWQSQPSTDSSPPKLFTPKKISEDVDMIDLVCQMLKKYIILLLIYFYNT